MRLYPAQEGLPEPPEAAELLLAMCEFMGTTQTTHDQQRFEEYRWARVLGDRAKKQHAKRMGKTIARNLKILNEVDQQLLDDYGIVTAVPHTERDGLVGIFGFSYSSEGDQYIAVVGDDPEYPENYSIAPDAIQWVPRSVVEETKALEQAQQTSHGV